MGEFQVRDRPLKAQELTSVNRDARIGLRLLKTNASVLRKGLAPLSDSDIEKLNKLGPRSFRKESAILIKCVRNYIDAVRLGDIESKKSLFEYLASIWGWQVCETLGWEWTWVEFEKGTEALAVASPDRAYVSYPLLLVHDNLEKPVDQDNTTASTYNWLIAGDYPTSSPNSFKSIASS